MKIKYLRGGNIIGFVVGIFCLIGAIICILRGYSGGFLYRSTGFECYLSSSLFILLGLFLISYSFWNKKIKMTWLECIVIFLLLLLCEIIPHYIVHHLK